MRFLQFKRAYKENDSDMQPKKIQNEVNWFV